MTVITCLKDMVGCLENVTVVFLLDITVLTNIICTYTKWTC